jgi:hypothetical protein
VFGLLGLQAFRNIPWWSLASAPILATYLARVQLSPRLEKTGACLITSKRQLRGNLIRGVFLVIVLAASLPWMKAANPWLAEEQKRMVADEYPEAAATFLASHSYGSHVFSDHAWSSYLDWRLWPTYRQLMDPSIEIHPTEVWLDIFTLNQGHVSWEDIADRFGVDVMLLRPDTQPLIIAAAERSPRWSAVYRDDQSVIFVRADRIQAAS